MEEAKKDGNRWLFTQILVFSMFMKNPDSFPVNSLKKKLFLLSWEKKV